MSHQKLERTVGENVCCWCFARDDMVLLHEDTETYWHEACFEEAAEIFQPFVDWVASQKTRKPKAVK